MNSKIVFVIVLALCYGINGCSKNNGDSADSDEISGKAVETAFLNKYPTASQVKWEAKNDFQEAEFVFQNTDYEAWYYKSGIWLQAGHSIAYADLPQHVKASVSGNINFPPSLWTPDNTVEVLERLNYLVWYGVELKKGDVEVTLWVDADAFRSEEVSKDFSDQDIPATISAFIAKEYPGALVTDAWQFVNNTYEANILHGSLAKAVYFSQAMDWDYTSWPVLPDAVPDVVKKALGGNDFAGFSVRYVEYQQFPDGNYYHYTLKQDNASGPDIEVDIDPQGNILVGE